MTSTRSAFVYRLAYASLMALSLVAGCDRHEEPSRAAGDSRQPTAPTTAASSAKGKAAAGDDACARLCAIATKLHCPRDGSNCQSDCSQMREPPICRNEMNAFVQCALGTSIADWHCDEDGESSVKEGVCEIEQGAVTRCVEQAQSAS